MAKVFIESLLSSPHYFAHVVVKPMFKTKWPLQQICLNQQESPLKCMNKINIIQSNFMSMSIYFKNKSALTDHNSGCHD